MIPFILNLELPSIGWQLFILDSSQSDPIALPAFLDTYATRLLTEPLTDVNGAQMIARWPSRSYRSCRTCACSLKKRGDSPETSPITAGRDWRPGSARP